jgi:hypothetical protein
MSVTLVVNIAQTVAVVATAMVAIIALQRARRERQADAQRARLDRLVNEILRLVDVVATAGEAWGHGPALAAARARLEAAMIVAGGAEQFPQTDILRRAPKESIPEQAKAALLEVTAAIAALG